MHDQKGNVLFLILIAVVLFAAISYAVTQSSRSGGSINKETALIQAAEIVQKANQIRVAIQRMKISNGCDETEIDFENPVVSGFSV